MIFSTFKTTQFLLIFSFCVVSSYCENSGQVLKQNNSNTNLIFKIKENTEDELFQKTDWFLNIPPLMIAIATSNSIPEGSCKTQLGLFLNHLKNGTLWATEMFDSSANYPYGVFYGLTRHLGSFDQCDNIKTILLKSEKKDKIEEIRSKYCLVDIKYKKKSETQNFIGEYDYSFDPQNSAWEALKANGDIHRYERNSLQLALCFPAKCKNEEIIAALKEPLNKINEQYDLQIEASIQAQYCHANDNNPKFSIYNWLYCCSVMLIILLVIISTILERKFVEGENNVFRQLFVCFSARRSLNAILRVKYKHRGFDCLHLIRTLFSIIVLITHRNLEFIEGANITGTYFESTFLKPFLGFISNSDIIIDGFLGMAGIIMSYYLLEYLEKSDGLQILPLIIKRFIRLAPSYLFAALACVFLIPHLGSGPFWESRVGHERDSCTSNWWINLFFIHNYVRAENICIPQTWSLAVDFQCYIIGILLIGAFKKMPRKIGYIFLGCILIVSAAIPFYVTYKYDVNPFIKYNFRWRDVSTSDYFINYYIKTHMRLSGYLVGVIIGALMYDYKSATWRLSEFWSQILFIVQSVLMPLFFQILAFYFLDPNLKPSAFEKALYACLHRPIFSFCICSIPLLLTIGQGLDFYYKLLTPKWIQPFSKISYGFLLTHVSYQSYELGTARTAFTFSWYNKIKHFVGDFIYVTFLSTLLVILIEIPFTNLGNLLLTGKKPIKSITSSDNAEKVD